MQSSSHSLCLSDQVRSRLGAMDQHYRDRALQTVSRSSVRAHGDRLRHDSRSEAGISNIAEVLLGAGGGVAEVRCSICTRRYNSGFSWPYGCVHTTGLLLNALDQPVPTGDRPTHHPMLAQSSGVIQYRLRRNQSMDLWSLSAHTLCRRYSDSDYPSSGTLADLLGSPSSRDSWSELQLHSLAEAVDLELVARRGVRKAVRTPAARPVDPLQAAFFDAVHVELTRRSAHSHGLLQAGTSHGGKVTIEASPLRVRWVSKARRCVTTDTSLRHVLSYDAGGVHVHTDAGSKAHDACPYAIDLLLLTLDYLDQKFTKVGYKRLCNALTVPPWEQNLQQLDMILSELGVDPTHTDVEDTPKGNGRGDLLGWQVFRREGSAWAIRAVWTRPYVRRTGLRVSDIHYGDISTNLSRYSRQDRAILQHAESHWITQYGTHAALFCAAVGHPRMVDAQREYFSYRVGTLGLALLPEANDALRLSFVETTTGRELSQDDVIALLDDRGTGTVCFDSTTRPPTLLALTNACARLVSALARRSAVLPAPARGALLARVPALRSLLPIELHPDLEGHSCSADLRPVLRLAPLAAGPIEVQVRIRPLPDGPLMPPGEGPLELESVVDGVRCFTHRDLSNERAAVQQALGDDADLFAGGADVHLPLNDTTLGRLHSLQARAQAGDIHLEWTGDALRVTRTAGPREVRVSVGGGKDWLALGGELQIDGLSIDLQRVMEAVRSGRRFVRIDGESWVGLSDQLRERLARLAARTRTNKRGKSTLAPLSGDVLEELARDGAEVDIPEQLKVEAAHFREAHETTYAIPSGLDATLRPYQADGLAWLQRMAHWAPGACLADDMGLGKTLQAIGLLLHRSADGAALVVAPTSLASNWAAEVARFAPALTLLHYRGPRRAGLLKQLGPHTVLVSSYDIVRRDVAKLARVGFHTVIYDEAQALKNPASQTARAAARMRGEFCLALSGTPVENRSTELWSLFRTLVPGLLGSLDWFRRQLALPADAGDEIARTRLSALVAPFLLRRTKREVARDLPERTEIIRRIPLSTGERRLYNAARLAGIQLREEDPRKARFAVLKALTRLRQLACDPTLVDRRSRVASSKLAALQELVDSIVHQGAQVLVFSQWTGLLDRVETTLSAHRCIRLDGRTPQKKRGGLVQSFQDGEADVFLISRQAGGTGLNLTAASYVIHLDPWWNPAAEDQATDRAHRIGQTQAVTVYRLIAEGTVEEGVLEMQAAKRELVESILEGTRSRHTPSLDELLALLQGEA